MKFHIIGSKSGGLKLNSNHLVFPLGRKISILNIDDNKQEFLCGHTNTVSAIAVSKWWVCVCQRIKKAKKILFCFSNYKRFISAENTLVLAKYVKVAVEQR